MSFVMMSECFIWVTFTVIISVIMSEQGKPEIGIVKQSRIRQLFKPSKQKVLASILILVLMALTFLIFVHQDSRNLDKQEIDAENPAYVISRKEYSKNQAEKLSKSPVSETADFIEKNAYYSELICHQLNAKDYQSVVAAYEKANKSAANNELYSFDVYSCAARGFGELNDKTNAVTALNQAELSARQRASNETILESYLQQISDIKRDYGL